MTTRDIETPRPRFSLARLLLVLIPAVALTLVWFKLRADQVQRDTLAAGEQGVLAKFGLVSPTKVTYRLDPKFIDFDSDLVADAPQDAALLISPEVLFFSYVAGPEAEHEKTAWQPLADRLATETGKKVEVLHFKTLQEQLTALATGKLHVAGFNTGAVPVAVNSAGFVPVCVAGKADGNFGHVMKVIVPAASKVKSLADLRGQTIVFTDRDSNSGCKAALLALKDAGLLPERDYLWRFSQGHDESIRGVAAGEYAAAPVASDLLQRAIDSGELKPDAIRSIYESERFPPAAIGYVYNLEPELANKVRTTLCDFAWREGTELAVQLSGSEKLVPLDFKNDFALIRRINDSINMPPVPEAEAE